VHNLVREAIQNIYYIKSTEFLIPVDGQGRVHQSIESKVLTTLLVVSGVLFPTDHYLGATVTIKNAQYGKLG